MKLASEWIENCNPSLKNKWFAIQKSEADKQENEFSLKSGTKMQIIKNMFENLYDLSQHGFRLQYYDKHQA